MNNSGISNLAITSNITRNVFLATTTTLSLEYVPGSGITTAKECVSLPNMLLATDVPTQKDMKVVQVSIWCCLILRGVKWYLILIYISIIIGGT